MVKRQDKVVSKHEKGFNIDKKKNFNDWYLELMNHTGIVDNRYPAKGFVVHTPMAAIPENIIFRMFEDALEKRGHKPVMFPTLIPENLLQLEKKHVEGFEPGAFWVTHAGKTKLDVRLALRPTSETAMYPLYKLWIKSHADLPMKLYQRANVFRHETKMTKPLLRDKEFHWLEAHDVFANEKEARAQVLQDIDTTKEVLYDKLGMPFIFFKRPMWDKFAGSIDSYAADVLMPDGKVIQLPSTHYYGTNFSRPFGIMFENKDGKHEYAHQTTYGPAVSRIFGTLISVHGDDKGLKFPFEIAPTQVVVVPLKNTPKLEGKAKEIHKKLKEMGLRVETDNSEKRPGAKYYYWETRGVPIRIELGDREIEGNKLTVARRDTGKKEEIQDGDLEEYIKDVGPKILDNLRAEAEANFKGKVNDAINLDEVKDILNKGGIARVNFFSMGEDGRNAAEEIYEATRGGEIRGTWHGKKEKPKGKCFYTGKEAKHVVYIARAH